MKKAIFLILITLVFSCKEKQTTKTTAPIKTETNFDWLIGNWERTNEEEGKKTFENWNKKSDTDYVGIGFTMKKNDTLSKENMQIVKTNKQWDLIVKSVGKGGDATPVSFKMTAFDKQSFTCENKDIDFPNTITYKKDGQTIKAVVANSDMEIPFVFERLKH
ncbi:MAG: DUF6265 family protein [Flavobacteriaceae bacterium]